MTAPLETSSSRLLAVILETRDGRAVSVHRNDSGAVRITAGGGPPAVLHLLIHDDERFAIRLSWEPEYLSMNAGGARISPTVGPDETFELVPGTDANAFGIRTAGGGRHLSSGPDAGAELTLSADGVGDQEVFAFDLGSAEGGDAPKTCCCGPSGHPHGVVDDTLWNEKTHRHIVELAVYLFAEMKDPTPEATWIVELWRSGYWKHILAGLKGADEWPEWMPLFPTFYFHFYDPDHEASWAFPRFLYPRHAVDRGTASFNESVTLFRDGADKNEACVRLGVSLHFLTDLCQPMHAANFINQPLLNDYRHSGYEVYADIRAHLENYFQRPDNYPALQRSEIEVTSTLPSEWLKTVARQSLATWKEDLKKEVEKKDLGWGRFENQWDWEAESSLRRSLWIAPRNAARYLCMWANRAM
jgi:hypothetical protein